MANPAIEKWNSGASLCVGNSAGATERPFRSNKRERIPQWGPEDPVETGLAAQDRRQRVLLGPCVNLVVERAPTTERPGPTR